MENSSKYRKPPLKRTRDSFIDDANLQTNRADFSQNRHLEVRRDKDKTRSLGITLYDVDFAIKSFIDKSIQLRIEDNGESIQVPTIYANSEKWASIQKDGFLKDKKGKTLAPLISFKRLNVLIKPDMKRNKVATTDQLAYFMQQKYNKLMPYDKFSILYDKRKSRDYFITPIPDYVDITYNFVIWGGQSFGEKNFFKFSTNLDNMLMEESNITGQDRLVRANFDLLVHAYLIPKEAANQVTTKRVVSPNKILFGAETFSSIDDILQVDSDTDSDLSNRGNIGITVRDQ